MLRDRTSHVRHLNKGTIWHQIWHHGRTRGSKQYPKMAGIAGCLFHQSYGKFIGNKRPTPNWLRFTLLLLLHQSVRPTSLSCRRAQWQIQPGSRYDPRIRSALVVLVCFSAVFGCLKMGMPPNAHVFFFGKMMIKNDQTSIFFRLVPPLSKAELQLSDRRSKAGGVGFPGVFSEISNHLEVTEQQGQPWRFCRDTRETPSVGIQTYILNLVPCARLLKQAVSPFPCQTLPNLTCLDLDPDVLCC